MKTVFVGLSGGVDSAVSAYLLKKQGYTVVGAFIKGWEPDFLPCTGKEDRLSAMQVAAHLGIPFVTYDLEEEYKRMVVDYFIAEYRSGRTPNPDVMCNRAIKFGAFWDKVKHDGANYIATGHYARNANGRLMVGVDTSKDQSYFLWTLTKDDLTHSLFPVGSLEKEDVRAIAQRIGLPNAKRRDSQGLCFLGHVDMQAFLKRYIPEKNGDVVLENGKKVGEHNGVWFYTLGQRHGFRATSEAGEDAKKLYVTKKDVEQNVLYVSSHPLSESAQNTYPLREINWIENTQPKNLLARYRYRQPLIEAQVTPSSISFNSPQSIAEGQSCVFYDVHGVVLGGGIISE